jgi:hypothetical protein
MAWEGLLNDFHPAPGRRGPMSASDAPRHLLAMTEEEGGAMPEEGEAALPAPGPRIDWDAPADRLSRPEAGEAVLPDPGARRLDRRIPADPRC